MKISTPCIGICLLDEDTGLCSGCGRTRHEIGGWSAMSETARLALMRVLPARLSALRSGPTNRATAASVSGRG